jgi:hypothetical protein
MKETELKNKIIAYLNSLPQTFAWRVEQRPGHSRGVSDVFCSRAGKILVIEAKIPKSKHPPFFGNEPTPLQWRFLKKVQEAGGTALVIYSLEQLKEEWI